MESDAEICTWIITAALFDAEDFDRRHCVYGKIGAVMAHEYKWAVIRHWARKAIAAFRQEDASPKNETARDATPSVE